MLRRRSTSALGLPLISPLARPYKVWASCILMLDLVYTAFLIPILVGFEVPDIGWGWGCNINLVAGAENPAVHAALPDSRGRLCFASHTTACTKACHMLYAVHGRSPHAVSSVDESYCCQHSRLMREQRTCADSAGCSQHCLRHQSSAGES